jgi:hypothetical protein
MGYNVLARRLPVATRHAIVCYPDNRRLDASKGLLLTIFDK